MAIHRFYIGGTGPFLFNDAATVPGGSVLQAAMVLMGGTGEKVAVWDSDGRLVEGTFDPTDALTKQIFEAKGDLIAGTANDTFAVLSVGTDGQILSADSAEPTGLKWIDAPTGGGGSGNIDGGAPDSIYGGTTPVDGGGP